jgi:hypothetical protein
MSRATWYRLGKPERKPRRITQAQAALQMEVSVRSLQRARRVMREAPDVAAQVTAGTLKLGTAERIVRERALAGTRAWLRAHKASAQ